MDSKSRATTRGGQVQLGVGLTSEMRPLPPSPLKMKPCMFELNKLHKISFVLRLVQTFVTSPILSCITKYVGYFGIDQKIEI